MDVERKSNVMKEPSPDATPSFQYTFKEKLSLFLPMLRQWSLPRRNLFAGPFAGEFGWELMQWQGFVRARRPHYEQVHVLTYPGRDYLYEGCNIHYHDVDLKSAGYGYGRFSRSEARATARARAAAIGLTNFDIFEPSLLCTRYHKAIWGQNFRLFTESPVRAQPYDVVFHFRAVLKAGPDQNKNYPTESADELAKRCRDHGMSIACIGHPEYSHAPADCDDYRDVDLRKTVAAICSAHSVAGENSGPMHLANLCGKPTIIWANDQWRVDYSLRWNPFRVPIFVAANNTHHPPSESIFEAIKRSLRELSEMTAEFVRPCYKLPPRQIAGY